MTSRAKATILDIAREAGVSKSTVSLVLQGSGLIRPETAVKVRKAIEDVGYVYNRGAANLRKAHSNVIGMVINDLTNPFFAELAVGMERVFQAAGIVPFIANTAENPVRQEEVLKSLLEQGVAGLIVSPARGTTPGAFRRIEAAGGGLCRSDAGWRDRRRDGCRARLPGCGSRAGGAWRRRPARRQPR
ncbi:LacI family DNA-binding transcriptional regulator, partial [Mesorhizobium sp.]|uniref:LacI family DNA-binding transcriptional regulator n=1 Tax=Mesorhizobium sp. TaxID=1871066 RepID=UPI0025C64930